MTPLRIGTRGSRLALWQANHIADKLRPLAAPRDVVLVEIQTTGDQVIDRPLSQIGGDGLFTKEIQRALLEGRADVAVHSLKDLPTQPVDGLVLAAVPLRGPTGDAFVSNRHAGFASLPQGAVVATSSLRRQAQLRHRRPDLVVVSVRGNVETRLQKLDQHEFDATILAEAGLRRLGLDSRITEILDPEWMLPAVGQGALGLECRTSDLDTLRLLSSLDDFNTHQAVLAERSLLSSLDGGCQVPIGSSSRMDGESLWLRGVVLDPAGRERIEAESDCPVGQAEALGRRLADQLKALGAERLLG